MARCFLWNRSVPTVNVIRREPDRQLFKKYLEYPEFQEYIAGHISPTWIDKVNEIKTRMLRGKEISEQINILGDDGVPVEYHVIF